MLQKGANTWPIYLGPIRRWFISYSNPNLFILCSLLQEFQALIAILWSYFQSLDVGKLISLLSFLYIYWWWRFTVFFAILCGFFLCLSVEIGGKLISHIKILTLHSMDLLIWSVEQFWALNVNLLEGFTLLEFVWRIYAFASEGRVLRRVSMHHMQSFPCIWSLLCTS